MDEADTAQEKMEIEEAARLARMRLDPLPPGTLCSCGEPVEPQRLAYGFRKCLNCVQTVERRPRNLLGRNH